jgi:hypothetical protein
MNCLSIASSIQAYIFNYQLRKFDSMFILQVYAIIEGVPMGPDNFMLLSLNFGATTQTPIQSPIICHHAICRSLPWGKGVAICSYMECFVQKRSWLTYFGTDLIVPDSLKLIKIG